MSTTEFTGERVIPGQVDVDLWNEHFARYVFAGQFVTGKRVLDAGCGTAYGSSYLARNAARVVAVDVAADAVLYAKEHERVPILHLLQSSCTALPFASQSFDVVVAFEVIEHLNEWPELLAEARRVLSPEGTFVVSTPNKSFYAESRGVSGANPFHVHEFELLEFEHALQEVFPRVTLFGQDHVDGIAFRPLSLPSGEADAFVTPGVHTSKSESSFFVAVCSLGEPKRSRSFVYIPKSSNLLKERASHIERLMGEVALKNDWLAKAQADHIQLLSLYDEQRKSLQESNRWASELDANLKRAGERILQLQMEVQENTVAFEEHLAVYQRETERLGGELTERSVDLERQTAELAKAVGLLDAAEATVIERTQWAQSLERERNELTALFANARESRWLRAGRLLGVGPDLRRSG